MNQQQSNALMYTGGGPWGTMEYAEVVCEKCGVLKGMLFFITGAFGCSMRQICAECWWKFTPIELNIEGAPPDHQLSVSLETGLVTCSCGEKFYHNEWAISHIKCPKAQSEVNP